MKFLYKSYSKLPDRGRLLASALGLLFVVVLANFANIPDVAYWKGRLGVGPQIAARVEKIAIEQTEVDGVASSGQISESEALDLLVETARVAGYYNQKDLTNAHLRFTDLEQSEVKELLYRDLLLDEILDDPYLKAKYYNALFKKRFAKDSNGAASGTLFVFPFSRYISGAFTEAGPLTDNPEAISEDKTYAKSKADSIRARVLAGEAIDTLLAEVKKDKRLVGGNIGNSSRRFTERNFLEQQGILARKAIQDEIFRFGKTGTTEIIEGKEPKTRRGEDSEEGELIGTHFFFVDIDSIFVPQPNAEERLREVKVRRYV